MTLHIELEQEADGRWIGEVPSLPGTSGDGGPAPDRLGSQAADWVAPTLTRTGWPDFGFAFHDDQEIGPRMLARIAKHTGLKPRTDEYVLPTAGASFALVVSQACVPTCPEYMSPCPKPFDVAAWRGDTDCQLEMQSAQCAEFLGCRARRGQKLSIPISHFYASLDTYDLKLGLSSAGCSGVRGDARRVPRPARRRRRDPVVAPLRQRSGLPMGTHPGSPYRSRTH